jgi:hypothetical protein
LKYVALNNPVAGSAGVEINAISTSQKEIIINAHIINRITCKIDVCKFKA